MRNLASIRKFGLEIKNRCTKEGLNGEKLASIPKSGLEIKNRCTKEGLNRGNLASIPKSGLEQPRMTQAKPFSFAAAKISIGRGTSLQRGVAAVCRRN